MCRSMSVASGIDLLSLAGHKFGGPKGVGALYIHAVGTTMQAVVHGGHQERERRAGTEDVPSIVALGKACALMSQRLADEGRRLTCWRDDLEAGVLSRIGAVHPLGKDGERLPNTANLSFTGVKGEALVFNLDLLGIAVSTGASCSSRQGVPSQVLEGHGGVAGGERGLGALQFGLGDHRRRHRARARRVTLDSRALAQAVAIGLKEATGTPDRLRIHPDHQHVCGSDPSAVVSAVNQ